MSNQWLRLWHDMPNDPKWRTISKVSGQPISLVLAVYVHVLVSASNATERGRTHGMSCEDMASALDVETSDIESILSAMQGRVLDGDSVTGWEKRQPQREDGAAERARAWREAKKRAEIENANATERSANATELQDKDTDKDKDKNREKRKEVAPLGARLPADWDPTPDELRWALDARPDLNIPLEVESFRDYWHGKPGKDGRKVDWSGTWRNWIRRANGVGFHRQPEQPRKTRKELQ